MKWLNLLAIVPIVLGILIFKNVVSGRKAPAKAPQPEIAVTVETETVESLALPRLLQGFGTVVSGREWSAIPQISGKVSNVHPKLSTGEYISQGQVLFVIETVDQELEQERILAERRAIQADIDQISARGEQLKKSIDLAEETLALLKTEEERYLKLFQAGATPASTVDARKREVLAQQRAIEDLKTTLATLPDQAGANRARIEAAEANIQKQSVQIGRSVVKAPFNGRLGEVYLEAGQVVSAGSALFTLQGSDAVRVEARFPQAQLADFSVQNAFIKTPSGERLPVKVGPLRERIDPVSRTASVQLTVPTGAEALLLPGALVEVTLEGRPHQAMPVVPRTVIRNGQIFLVENGRLLRRPVETAFTEGDYVALKSGAKAGDTVVVSDPGLAMDGSQVRIAGAEK